MMSEERLAIHELMARAAYALDERDLDMLAGCFAGDAVLTLQIAGGEPVGPFDGHEAIMGLMKGSMEQQTDQRRHVISNLFIDPTGDGQARVTSNLTLLATENGVIRVVSAGIYRDEVRRDGDRWLLARRHIALDLPY